MLARATARIGSPAESGSTTARITGGERGIRPQHQNAAGTEQRVGEQRDDRGVQAVDSRDARSHCVGDSDRHQHRGQHQAGHQIVRQPGGFVPAQDLQSGQPTLPAVHRKWFLFDLAFIRNRRVGARIYLPRRTHSYKPTERKTKTGKISRTGNSPCKMLVRERTREFQPRRFYFRIFLSATRSRIARRNFSRSAGLSVSSLRFIASATVLA